MVGIIINIVFYIMGLIIGGWFLYVIQLIVGLLLYIPNLAVGVRRLHDTGKGGGWIFISLVPLIGWIWFIILMAQRGEAGSNRFGESK